MILLWLITLIAALIIDSILFIIITRLVDFQVDHINPLDICATLGRYVNPLLYFNIAICALSVFQIKTAWPILLAHLAIIGYMTRRLRKPRYFEPMTIVRDANKYKLEHIIYLAVSILAALYCFVRILLEAISN